MSIGDLSNVTMRCERCQRLAHSSETSTRWRVSVRNGEARGLICPLCVVRFESNDVLDTMVSFGTHAWSMDGTFVAAVYDGCPSPEETPLYLRHYKEIL